MQTELNAAVGATFGRLHRDRPVGRSRQPVRIRDDEGNGVASCGGEVMRRLGAGHLDTIERGIRTRLAQAIRLPCGPVTFCGLSTIGSRQDIGREKRLRRPGAAGAYARIASRYREPTAACE